MKRFRVFLIPMFFVMAFFAFDAVTSDAYAQGRDSQGVKNNDKEIGSRSGVKESLAKGGKGVLDEDGPTKTQMWLGLGSIPVMIIVVKYL